MPTERCWPFKVFARSKRVDALVAKELVEHGYAEIVDGKLRITDDGLALRSFEEMPLDS
jgi:hypothetical protein